MAYLGSPKETLEVINKYGFAFQKRFGQNFLIDSNILEKYCKCCKYYKRRFCIRNWSRNRNNDTVFVRKCKRSSCSGN